MFEMMGKKIFTILRSTFLFIETYGVMSNTTNNDFYEYSAHDVLNIDTTKHDNI